MLHGRAWSATGPVKRVDVSTDGRATWQRARLHEPNRRSAWVRFSLPWRPPHGGPAELIARATGADGLRQPDRVPFNADGYMFYAAARQPVTVTG